MKAINITDIKEFMNKLLIKEDFDSFLIEEASITTYNTFKIDGHICKSYYSEDEYNDLPQKALSYWSVVKPLCYQIIKGRKTPVKFQFVFKLSKHDTEAFLSKEKLSYNSDDISGLYLNIRYENMKLDCISAVSLKNFSLDKTVENAFDTYIERFFISTHLN